MPDIKDTVGDAASKNDPPDVAIVQLMLRVVTDAKKAPYLSANYNGKCLADTKTAILNFQKDHKLAPVPPDAKAAAAPPDAGAPADAKAPPPLLEKALGTIQPGGATIKKLTEMLPVDYKDMLVLNGKHITLYLPDPAPAAQANANTILADGNMDPTFRHKAAKLVQDMYATYKLAMYSNRRRATFQDQFDVNPARTKAGPGESNHNYGRALDLIFKSPRWIKGDGTIVNDQEALQIIEHKDNIKFMDFWEAMWKLRDAGGLFKTDFPDDQGHVQDHKDAGLSMGKRLVVLLNAVGKTEWKHLGGHPNQYMSDISLKGQFINTGTTKQIWQTKAQIATADVAAALNAKKVPLEVARKIWEGKATIAAVKPDPAFKNVKSTDIQAADVTAIRKLLRSDFDAAEKDYKKWTP